MCRGCDAGCVGEFRRTYRGVSFGGNDGGRQGAGYSHVNLDGTLIDTDRVATPGPKPGVDLWWSGKHHHHGGNVQVVSAPDGWPLWTSQVRPGREHDTTCLR